MKKEYISWRLDKLFPAFLSENVKKGTIIFSVKTEACGSPFDTLGQKTDKKPVLSSISKWSSLKIVHIQVDMFDTVVTTYIFNF